MSNFIFVYGSLKRGFSNHFLLENSKFLGEFITDPEYKMISLGYFPGVILEGNTSIYGEIYEVDTDTFKRLDTLEGYPSFYDRVEIETDYGNTWMYYLKNLKGIYRVVEDGIWKHG